jgi:hypothetical protein
VVFLATDVFDRFLEDYDLRDFADDPMSAQPSAPVRPTATVTESATDEDTTSIVRAVLRICPP